MSKNKITSNYIPPKLQYQDKIITDPQQICECFNEYFTTIGSNLCNDIPTQFRQINNVLLNINTNCANELQQLKPTSADEVLKIISCLDSNVSAGVDGINTKTLKCIKKSIVNELTDCINTCFTNGEFPDSLKIAKVSPIYKSGSKMEPGNYRPISVLPTISKIFEKIIHDRLFNYLNSIQFLFKRQYGFRPKSNTSSATIDLITKLKNNIDSKNIALGVFIDLKKAFDTVSHPLLLNKLKQIGIKNKAYSIFESYLTNRHQIVKLSQYESSPLPINCGVPQGSIIGPLLFLTYINNLHEAGLQGHLTLYADDTCLFYFGSSLSSIIQQAQQDLDLLFNWFQSNLLTINTAKTCYVIFSAKNKKIEQNLHLYINGELLEKRNHEKYLGLILDSQLTWKAHIAKTRPKITSLIAAMRNISNCLPKQVRINIYNALIKPHLEYLAEIWGNAAMSNLKDLQIAQNKVIKVLFNYDYLTSTKTLYQKTGLMNLKQIYVYKTCLLIRKILDGTIHSEITFNTKSKFQRMKLRNADHLALRFPRTRYGTQNLMHDGAKLYNNLPKTLKDTKTFKTFKSKLKSHVTNNIT